MRKLVRIIIPGLLAGAVFAGPGLGAQAIREAAGRSPARELLPLRRLALFSSGVGYFEHSGTLSGAANITLSFSADAVNDALKSLTLNDPLSASPAIRYPSEDTLYRTLKSLSVDLSGNPGLAELLGGQRGAELEISLPSPLSGRIIGVEQRPAVSPSGAGETEAWLSLLTAGGIRVINLKDIGSFAFKDPGLNADLGRALDLLLASRDGETRELQVELSGGGTRPVSLSYVIPAPVWKVSYRLDLSGPEPLLQGWAIVDNGGDTDWEGVELSLVAGRPVSFIQNLYPPLRLSRPTLPLSIAGIARAETYGSSRGAENSTADEAGLTARAMGAMEKAAVQYDAAPAPAPLAGGVLETARAAEAGDQFEFTLPRPVTLARRQSAMFPLVEGALGAEKGLIFSGARLSGAETVHPLSGAELVNTTGMKLPAGPLTVYDGGTYAGDALIEFFPPGEKRLVSWGEDLSVTGSAASATIRTVSAVVIREGLMTISRRQGYEKTYTLRNASAEEKRIILEHPVTPGTSLAEPASFEGRTAGVYRFIRNLPAGGELSLLVREERPLSEQVSLGQIRPESLLGYASSQEIPAPVRGALQKALDLRRETEEARTALADLESRRDRLVSEQDRIRRNLEAAGNQTPQGQDYLRRMIALDGEIDGVNADAAEAAGVLRAAQTAYDAYLGSLNL